MSATILSLVALAISTPANSAYDLAVIHSVAGNVLCEVNNCQAQPQLMFSPKVNLISQERRTVENYTGFAGYPLPSVASVALSYGWHRNLITGQTTFHSGIDLLADIGTPVLSVDAGTVAFAGLQGSYGNLVVINHQGGRQTRYAHLKDVNAIAGQKVKTGDTLGTVGTTGRPDLEKSHLHFEVRYNSPVGWVAEDPEPNFKTNNQK